MRSVRKRDRIPVWRIAAESLYAVFLLILLTLVPPSAVEGQTAQRVYDPPEPEPRIARKVAWPEQPKTIQARVTAYAPFDNKSGICADSDPTNTATMKYPGRAYAAVDPSRIPYGTKLLIPGYGEVEAQDRGGALVAYDGYAIDVYFDTYEECMAWGEKYLEIEIIEEAE